ncbi:MAG: hypothetical protein RQ760_05240 [Sedimentisphaerales bacterium]|nr:hypothetical protein [Sedimentisphaerales bacterium]
MANKIRNNKAKTDRQICILLIVISLVLVQLSGCSPAPSSPLTQIDREPPDFPQIRLNENICPSQTLYNFLKQAGKGKIGPHANADYSITRLELDSDIRISDRMASYRLYCEVSDNYNNKVIETFANRIVKGRFEPGTDYRDTASTWKYEEFIAKDAAIQLMNDLYKKMPAVVAAQP